jgi:outer membrane protein
LITSTGGRMTIRKIAIAVTMTLFLVAIGIPVGYCADVAKIGTVNFEKIFNNSTAGKAAKNQIKEEGQRMNADLVKIQDEIKSLQQLLGKDGSAAVMNDAARENKKWELNRKIEEVKALKKRFDRKIQELQMRLVNTVRKEVLTIIHAYGKKEGYLMIIEDLNLVYAPQTLDITDKVIQIYNSQTDKKTKK